MLKGVMSVEPGYAGGSKAKPNYEQVSDGNTGYAEVIKIEYDPAIIPLETLLTVFFATHDPTTKNRQGNDVGEQYRSIILYSTDEQKKISEKFIEELNIPLTNSAELVSGIGAPIVTEIKELEKPEHSGSLSARPSTEHQDDALVLRFYPAEDYHKNYYENNKGQTYCQVVINPKLKKVQEKFVELLKES